MNLITPYFRLLFFTLFILICSSAVTRAQTGVFTYQGQLNDGASAASGTYNMQFSLFDAATGGNQIGSTITNTTISVLNGVFTVQLDFSPATPFATGATRYLQIAVKKPADASYTTLTPRQQITSSPYSIRTISATTSDALSSACVTCVTDAQIAGVAGSKVTGTVANAATATSAGNVTGTVAVANGGTGATSAANARTNLGLGSLATVTPTGTANNTTFLRGDNTYAAIGGGGATLQLLAINTTAQSLAAATTANLNFNNITTVPTAGTFNGMTFTATTAGLYLISVNIAGTGSAAGLFPTITVNGSPVAYSGGAGAASALGTNLNRNQVSTAIALGVNDTVTISVINVSPTNSTSFSTDGTTRLAITKLN